LNQDQPKELLEKHTASSNTLAIALLGDEKKM
jgi:hypothetical protein